MDDSVDNASSRRTMHREPAPCWRWSSESVAKLLTAANIFFRRSAACVGRWRCCPVVRKAGSAIDQRIEMKSMFHFLLRSASPLNALCAFATAFTMTGALAQAESNPNMNAQLLVAARQGDRTAAERVLNQGAVIESRNRVGKTALLIACEKGDLPLADMLLRHGAQIATPSLEGVTPLIAASYAGNPELVKRLLAAGAKTDPIDHLNKSAVIYAAGLGHVAVVGALLDTGIDIDQLDEHHLTLLMWAAGQGYPEVVKLLLARGAKADLRDDRGMTALDIARQTKQSAAAGVLMASSGAR